MTTHTMSRRASLGTEHRHAPEHLPAGGTGYQVCACGATRRVEQGRDGGDWHACARCVRDEGGEA